MRRYVRVLPALLLILTPVAALAQGAPAGNQTSRITLPTVVVTAQKEPGDAQQPPLTVTTRTNDLIAEAGARIISNATTPVPNTLYSEITARTLSTARFRGIGGRPTNPCNTTYVAGVPQLNTNTSSF